MSRAPPPPSVQAWFDAQQHEQRQLAQCALIQADLRSTHTHIASVLERGVQRGQQVSVSEEQSEELLDTAQDFYEATLPAWRRYVRSWVPPAWWWPACVRRRWCGGRRRKVLV